MSQKIAIPVLADGTVDVKFGKAHTMAIATIEGGELINWQEEIVEWEVSHDSGTHGAHHARIVKFMKANEIDLVLAEHIGESMQNTLQKLGVPFKLEVTGDAKQAALAQY